MITPYILWFTWHFTSAQPRQVDHQGTQSAHLPSGLARESGAQLISSASDPRVDQLAWPQPCETIPGWCKLQLCGSKLMVIKVKKYWKISQSNWDDGSKIVLTTPDFFVMVNPEGDINVRQKKTSDDLIKPCIGAMESADDELWDLFTCHRSESLSEIGNYFSLFCGVVVWFCPPLFL